MQWSDFDFWRFLAGLGIFMFGMFLLEEAIKQVSGKAFKTFIRRSTTGKIRSVGTGFVSTAVLQSSSAVTLMTLTFVGAGMITMQNAIGVVLGTNLGTTATSWLVATVGFKINIEGMFLPLIGLGGLGLIFLSQSTKYAGISKLLVGLGFLFMGLDYMKLSVEGFTSSFDIALIPKYGVWFYVLIGIVLTSVMQSSSASMAVVLTALNSGLLTFNEGAAMVIGANIGTTTTVMLGAMGGVPLKKQVAFSHLIFNVITGVFALITLPLLTRLVLFIIDEQANAVIGVTLFHTLFNLLGVLMFLPFVPMFARWIQRIYPEKAGTVTHYIGNASADLPEAAEAAVRKESFRVLHLTLKLISQLLHLENQEESKASKSLLRNLFQNSASVTPLNTFDHIQKINNEILVFASKIATEQLAPEERKDLTHMNHLVLVCSQVSKAMIGIEQDLEGLEQSENKKVLEILGFIKEKAAANLIILDTMTQHPMEDETLSVHQERIKNDYKSVVEHVSRGVQEEQLHEKETGSLLMVNGFITQSVRQLFRAVEKAY